MRIELPIESCWNALETMPYFLLLIDSDILSDCLTTALQYVQLQNGAVLIQSIESSRSLASSSAAASAAAFPSLVSSHASAAFRRDAFSLRH